MEQRGLPVSHTVALVECVPTFYDAIRHGVQEYFRVAEAAWGAAHTEDVFAAGRVLTQVAASRTDAGWQDVAPGCLLTTSGIMDALTVLAGALVKDARAHRPTPASTLAAPGTDDAVAAASLLLLRHRTSHQQQYAPETTATTTTTTTATTSASAPAATRKVRRTRVLCVLLPHGDEDLSAHASHVGTFDVPVKFQHVLAAASAPEPSPPHDVVVVKVVDDRGVPEERQQLMYRNQSDGESAACSLSLTKFADAMGLLAACHFGLQRMTIRGIPVSTSTSNTSSNTSSSTTTTATTAADAGAHPVATANIDFWYNPFPAHAGAPGNALQAVAADWVPLHSRAHAQLVLPECLPCGCAHRAVVPASLAPLLHAFLARGVGALLSTRAGATADDVTHTLHMHATGAVTLHCVRPMPQALPPAVLALARAPPPAVPPPAAHAFQTLVDGAALALTSLPAPAPLPPPLVLPSLQQQQQQQQQQQGVMAPASPRKKASARPTGTAAQPALVAAPLGLVPVTVAGNTYLTPALLARLTATFGDSLCAAVTQSQPQQQQQQQQTQTQQQQQQGTASVMHGSDQYDELRKLCDVYTALVTRPQLGALEAANVVAMLARLADLAAANETKLFPHLRGSASARRDAYRRLWAEMHALAHACDTTPAHHCVAAYFRARWPDPLPDPNSDDTDTAASATAATTASCAPLPPRRRRRITSPAAAAAAAAAEVALLQNPTFADTLAADEAARAARRAHPASLLDLFYT